MQTYDNQHSITINTLNTFDKLVSKLMYKLQPFTNNEKNDKFSEKCHFLGIRKGLISSLASERQLRKKDNGWPLMVM